MDSDDLLDYWEDEGWVEVPSDDDLTISLYSLPVLAVGFVSLVLVVLLAVLLPGDPAPAAVVFAAAGGEAESEQPSDRPAGRLPLLFTPSVLYWERDILRWSAEHALDPSLVATVMQIESCGHPEVVSSAGAAGLFQVMPFHFQSGESASEPDTNAARGLAYLGRSLEAHSGDVYYALAGYNAGIGGSQRGEDRWPAETKRYTYWGMGIYTDARNGDPASARLDEWLSSGGASLCRKAEVRLGLAP